MEIPYAIRRAASWYLNGYPEAEIISLGLYMGDKAFYVRMPDDAITGYPPVFLLKKGKAVEVIGPEGLEILSSFSK